MSDFFRLVCDFEVLTPMFLGGADQNTAELRAPSVKGAMRFWYRAFDPDFDKREPLYFGSGGERAGQSRLIVRCRPGQGERQPTTWSKLTQGIERQTANGLVYLGFPFGMKGNEQRTAILPGDRFTVEVSCHRSAPDEPEHGSTPLRAALASMWGLGHFGALGTRARRGFGAVAITGWRLEGRDGAALPSAADLAMLPLLHRTSNAVDWMAGARRGIEVLRGWYRDFEKHRSRHPCFGSNYDLLVWPKHQHKRGDWRGALQAIGQELQSFRQRRPPDYGLVRSHIQSESSQGGRRIEQAPSRTTFGLPLTFRYRSLPHGRPVTFVPDKGERHGSLLFLRPVLAGSALFGLFLRLDGDVPGVAPRARVRGPGRPLEPPAPNAMDDFMRELKGKAGR